MKVWRKKTLFSKNSKNQLIEWNIEMKEINDGLFKEYLVIMYSGLFMRSRMNKPDKFLVKAGKNIGKSNETTAFEQAKLECDAKWKHKIEREGYVNLFDLDINVERIYNLTEDEILALLPKHKSYTSGSAKPMKAVSLKDIKVDKLVFPYYAQHKLNGVRCTANGDAELISKDGLKYNIPQVQEELKEMYSLLDKSIILDGELYKHGWILSKINQACASEKKKVHENTKELEYWIFDVAIDDVKQRDRLKFHMISITNLIIAKDFKFIKTLSYDMCNNYEEMLRQTKHSIDLGYEGAIFRNPHALYQFGKRNINMIKSKVFMDGEFMLVDIIPYDKNPKLGTLVFKNDITDGTFKSEWEGSHEEKAEMLKNKKKYIGKMFTVKYYERTINDLPFHTKAIAIRNYE